MIEIHWGEPLSFVMSPGGDVQKFTTIEQARHWLRRKWPVSDEPRARAIGQLEAAMDCLTSVGTARRAFIAAAKSAGFVPESLIIQSSRIDAGRATPASRRSLNGSHSPQRLS